MARVLVTRALPGTALERLRALHAVDVWAGDLPPDPPVLRERAAQAEGLLTMLTDSVDAALLDAAPRLRVSANYAVGTDNVDLELCARRGVWVGVTPDVLTEATADLTFALILAAARNLVAGHEAVRGDEWRTWEPRGWLGHDVHGATLALIGPGRIGEAVARRAKGFSMEVLRVGRGDDLLAALRQADVISLHCPLTPQTRHLVDGGGPPRRRRARRHRPGAAAAGRPAARRPEPPRPPPRRLGHPHRPGRPAMTWSSSRLATRSSSSTTL